MKSLKELLNVGKRNSKVNLTNSNLDLNHTFFFVDILIKVLGKPCGLCEA